MENIATVLNKGASFSNQIYLCEYTMYTTAMLATTCCSCYQHTIKHKHRGGHADEDQGIYVQWTLHSTRIHPGPNCVSLTGLSRLHILTIIRACTCRSFILSTYSTPKGSIQYTDHKQFLAKAQYFELQLLPILYVPSLLSTLLPSTEQHWQ